MDINIFFNEFKKYIDYLNDEGVLIGNEDPDELEDGIFTYEFNISMYLLAKYNLLSILPEHRIGRGGYSDILLCSRDGKNKIIEIEHENQPFTKSNGNLKLTHNLEKFFQNKRKSDVIYVIYAPSDFSDADEFELSEFRGTTK